MTPQETSQTCLWVSRSLWQRHGSPAACRGDRGADSSSAGSHGACWHRSLCRHYYRYPYHSLARGQTTGRGDSPTLQQKIGLKIYYAWPTYQSKTQIPLQPVPLIRRFPQASFSYPSEDRKLTKLITWITALSNSMKL